MDSIQSSSLLNKGTLDTIGKAVTIITALENHLKVCQCEQCCCCKALGKT